MQNAMNSILLQEAAISDPFFRYVLLGDDLAKDSLFAWFSFGVNTTSPQANINEQRVFRAGSAAKVLGYYTPIYIRPHLPSYELIASKDSVRLLHIVYEEDPSKEEPHKNEIKRY